LTQGAVKIHTILQLDYIPTPEQKEQLRQQGIELLTYIPNYAWLAAVPATNPAQVADVSGVRWVGSLTVQDKLQPELQAQELQPWAYDPASELIALLIQFHRDISLEQGSAVVKAHGGKVVDQVTLINTLIVHLHKDKVSALAAEDTVEWIEQPLPLLEPINDGNRARAGADTLQAPPYNLDGTDVDVLVYDGGRVYSHSDLDSKRTWGDTALFSEHATHVACTVLGDGTINSTYRGMAPNAELLSMGFEDDGTGVFLYTNPGDIQNDLDYAKNTWSPSADLFNASIGTNTAPNGFPCSLEGNYGATAQLVDAIVGGSLGEAFIAAWANGNERGSGRCGTTYRTTAPPACAKNPIHSGATDSTDDSMSSFSSWGPCDDGRLKPTISSPGVSVMSCNDSNGYTSMSGTSMASPTTAGVIALMLEQYRATYSTSGEFLPSTVKALLMHTAVDLGNAGPDYQFGYGRIDGVAAVDAIMARDFREETITAHGQIDEYTITVSGSPSELRASLAWDDPTGSLAALKKLVNDLDLELQAPDGTIYYPWVLDPSNPTSPAATGVDDINNQEQVVVNSPMNGTWTVRVKAATVPEAPQDYSLAFPGADTAPKSTTPGGGPPPPPPTFCSEAITNGDFESGPSPWVWSGSAAQSSTYAHSGTYSGEVGGTSNGYFYQQIVLPSDFYTGTLTYWIRMDTTTGGGYYDWFEAEILDESDNTLTTLQVLHDGDSYYQGTWRQETFTLDSEYAGQTIRLYFEADVTTVSPTYWYIDDVSLDACHATGGNTPPILSGLPDQTVPSNSSANNAIDLWAYADDAQDEDSDLTFTIDNTPDPNAGVSIDSNRYIDINPTPGWAGQTTVIIRVTDTGDLSDTDMFQATVIAVASFPFCDGFESGILGTGWMTYTTNEGRVQVSPSYPYSGTYSVLLDDSTGNTTYSYAAIILTIDLSGQSNVVLDFWWRDFGDEDHADDGVFFSDDLGSTWVTAMNFTGSQSSYTNKVIGVDANGLTLNDHFQIKLQFYDNYPITSDGYAIDEVCVYEPPAPDIQVSPISFEETVHEGNRVTRTLTISNTGTTSLTFNISEQAGGFTPAMVTSSSVDNTGPIPPGPAPVTVVPPASFPPGWDDPDVGPAVAVMPMDVPSLGPLAWTGAASMPTARARLASATDQGCLLYAIGGMLMGDGGYFNHNEVYDPQSDSWATLTPMPTARSNVGAAVVDGVIYVPGGYYDGSYLNTHEAYDIAGDSWSSKAPLPTAYSGGVVAAVNGRIYHMGGSPSGGHTNANYEYDPITDSWSTKTAAPEVFAYAGGTVLNGHIYIAGGWLSSSSASTRFLRYDPVGDSWTVLTPMNQGRQSPGLVAAGGYVYAFGGGVGWTALNSTEQYDPSTNTWTSRPDIPLNVGRLGMATGWVRGMIWGAGGYSGSATEDDNEYLDEGYADNCGSDDVPWLSEDPITGTVPVSSSLPVDVIFDATGLAPGAYTADLVIHNNDPDENPVIVPVTMTVPPEPNMGKLFGVVTSDRPAGPLEDALVEVLFDTTRIISGTTDADGSYGPWWLINGTYTVTISADDYFTDTQSVTITAQQTTTHNVMLILNAPQIEVAPASFDEELDWEEVVTRTLTISNAGTLPLDFEMYEIPGGFGPLVGTLGADGDSAWLPDDIPTVQVVKSTRDELVLDVRIAGLATSEVQQNDTVYRRLHLPYSGATTEVGKPELPTFGRFLALPQGAQVEVEVLDAISETIGDVLIYPAQEPQPDGPALQEEPPFVIDEDFYAQDFLYPGRVATVDEAKTLRGCRSTVVRLYPFQYNPARRELTSYSRLRVRLRFVGAEGPFVNERYRAPSFENLYRRLFLNYEQLGAPQPTPAPESATGAEFLIITHPDFQAAADDLAAWRNIQSIDTRVRTTAETGSTATEIRAYIQDAYDTWSPPPEFVLFLGDAEFVPTNYQTTHPYHGTLTGTDLYYATVDGSDYYPDIHTGRISVDTVSEAQKAINDIIDFDRNPVTDEAFYENVSMAAYFQDDDFDGYEDRRFVLTSEEIRDYLLTQGYTVERIYHTEPGVNPTNYNDDLYANGEPLPPELLRPTFAWDGDADDVTAAIAAGRFILNHRDHGATWGWGDPYYHTSHVQSLANGNELPVVFSMNCQTGWFDNETDDPSDGTGYTTIHFSEAWQRNPNGGAVGVIGATRVSYSGYNDWMTEGFYDAIWPDFLAYNDPGFSLPEYRMGVVLNYGKLAMETLWGDAWGYQEVGFEIFHYFGDPTTKIHTALPTGAEVTWLSEYPISDTVTVDDAKNVNVVFDAGAVDQPGEYTAQLQISSNDLYNRWVYIPVTMTVRPPDDWGELLGTVTSDRPGGALEGALVDVISGTTSVISDTADAYGPWWLEAGDYTIIVSAEGYQTDAQIVTIIAQQTTTHNVTLMLDAPQIEVTPTSMEETVAPNRTVTKTLVISNTGTQPLDFEIRERDKGYVPTLLFGPEVLNPPQADNEVAPSSRSLLSPLAMGDELFQINASSSTGHAALLGVEYALDSYWVTSAGQTGSSDPNYLFQLDGSGAVLNSWAQPTASTWGWRDLAFDGTYLYASDSDVVEQINPADGQPTGVTVPCPTNPCRALAYDPATDHFWTANFSSDVWEFDRSGTIINTYPNTLSIYGMAWDSWSPGGPYLWAWSQDGTPPVLATQIDPTTGALTGVAFTGSTLPGLNIAGGATISPDIIPDSLVFVGMHQADSNIIVGYDMDVVPTSDVPWLREDPITDTVSASDSLSADVILDATGLDLGDYYADLVIYNTDPYENPVTVPITLHVTSNNPPYEPSDPSPADGATGQDLDVDLSWTGGDPDPGDTVTYAVYFEAGDSTPDDLLTCDDAATPACDPGILDHSTPHFWFVVATDNHGASITGTTWVFTTTLAPAPAPGSINPSWGYNGQVVHITNLAGSNFQTTGTTIVELTKSGESDIVATNVDVVSAFKITCDLDLRGAASGQWTVVVINPDSQRRDLPDAFTVKIVVYLPVILRNWH